MDAVTISVEQVGEQWRAVADGAHAWVEARAASKEAAVAAVTSGVQAWLTARGAPTEIDVLVVDAGDETEAA